MEINAQVLEEFEDTKGSVNRRRTENTMVKRKKTKGQTMIYTTRTLLKTRGGYALPARLVYRCCVFETIIPLIK